MSKYILPVFIFAVIIAAFIKKVPVYDNFVKGSKESISLILSIFPYICAVLIAVELFSLSGLNAYLAKIMSPLLGALGIPDELCELLIIRPLSGNGSLAILEDIYKKYGADAYTSRCSSPIVDPCVSVLFVHTVYFSSPQVIILRYAIPISLIACYIGAIVACLLCRIM